MSQNVVLLHGFGGTRRSWMRVSEGLERERYRPLALDIRGHGGAAALRPVNFEACVVDIEEQAPDTFTLCGYSLGGRIALHVALALSSRVERLVIVSASAGIDDQRARADRLAADERLAQMLDRGEAARFIEHWRGLPLFAGDPEWVKDEVVAEQRRADPGGLAAALRGLGAGGMEPLWGRLHELAMDTTVLVGERDEPYLALASRYREVARVQVVPGVGHRIPLEDPSIVVAACRA